LLGTDFSLANYSSVIIFSPLSYSLEFNSSQIDQFRLVESKLAQ